MNLIDMHCDTILSFFETKGEVKLTRNNLCIDIQKLKKARSIAQFFAVFVDLEKYKEPMSRCLSMIERFYDEIKENNADISFAGSIKDLVRNREEGKISAFLTVEEGGVLEGKLQNLAGLYKKGVRLITLTWNYPNCIGYPNFQWEHKDKGLTSFGQEVVAEMNRLGMLIDVSHLSDQGFYDVARLSDKPFVASHSDARAVVNHWRNLSEDMLKKLAEKGGVTGLNLEPEFLGDGGSVEAMTRHIIHMTNTAGIEAVAIGSDFDGSSPLTAIKDISEMGLLGDALKKAGFSEGEIEKIMYKNTERLLRDVMNS